MSGDLAAKNVAIVGCSNDPKEANAKFAEENGFSFPLLCDTDLSVSVAYGAVAAGAKNASRVAALIDEAGNVAKYYDPAGKGEFPAQVLADAS